MGTEDILAQAASATQQMTPNAPDELTSFGPQPLVQPPPIPHVDLGALQPKFAQGEFATVGGRKRADRQALIGNLANAVKVGADYIQAKKQRNLSMTIERLMSAQEGLTEAKMANNQEGIQRNTAIINDITSDPKTAKLLQKALNIDLFGDGKNKNENQALMEAWKNYNARKVGNPNTLNPIAERLQAAQPMRQQLSPEAQAQAAAIKAGLIPKAGELLKASQENFKAIMQANDVQSRNASLETAAKTRADAERYHADKVLDAATARVLGSQAVAEINQRSRKYQADSVAATWDKRLNMMDSWQKMKTGNSPIFKQLYQEATTYNNHLKQLSKENTDLQKEIDAQSTGTIGKFFGMHKADTPELKQMRFKLLTNNLAMEQEQKNLDSITMKMKTLDTMGIVNFSELGKGESGPITVNSNSDSESDADQVEVRDSQVPE